MIYLQNQLTSTKKQIKNLLQACLKVYSDHHKHKHHLNNNLHSLEEGVDSDHHKHLHKVLSLEEVHLDHFKHRHQHHILEALHLNKDSISRMFKIKKCQERQT